jgi:hypothetical protein
LCFMDLQDLDVAAPGCTCMHPWHGEPVWLETWMTCLVKSVARKLPEILIKSASPTSREIVCLVRSLCLRSLIKREKYVFLCL